MNWEEYLALIGKTRYDLPNIIYALRLNPLYKKHYKLYSNMESYEALEKNG